MARTNGASSSRKGRGARKILSLKSIDQAPENHSQHPGIEQDSHSQLLDGIQAFEAALWRSRNEWSVRQHRRGMFGRKLDRSDADRALKLALAEIGGDR